MTQRGKLTGSQRVPAEIVFRASPAFNLRMPEPMRKQLDEAARENGRSVNAEIVYRLRQSFEGWKQ